MWRGPCVGGGSQKNREESEAVRRRRRAAPPRNGETMDIDKILSTASDVMTRVGLKVLGAIAIFIVGRWLPHRPLLAGLLRHERGDPHRVRQGGLPRSRAAPPGRAVVAARGEPPGRSPGPVRRASISSPGPTAPRRRRHLPRDLPSGVFRSRSRSADGAQNGRVRLTYPPSGDAENETGAPTSAAAPSSSAGQRKNDVTISPTPTPAVTEPTMRLVESTVSAG